MSASAAGAVVGLLTALGVCLVTARALALRPPTMLERIAPYVPANAHLRAHVQHAPSMGRVLLALARPSASRPSGASLEQRLAQAGLTSVDRYRLDQAAAAGLGACVSALLGLGLVMRGAAALCLPLLTVSGAIAGAMAVDRLLVRRIRSRQERIAGELPAVAELLALAAAAGESPAAAVERACTTLGGELAHELAYSLNDVRSGLSFDLAMRQLADRIGSPEITRFIDAFVIAIERGAPLADVLRAQASDVRAAQRRALMEKAGRKEVAMLIPVVFLILPTVVLIAVFPGVQGLRLVVSS